jgi:putative membrane protein
VAVEDGTGEPGRGWLAARLLPGGTEPDARFTLANERTFLAWIRTSLAFLAGGIALEAFASELFAAPLRQGLAIFIISIGMLVSLGAAFRWLAVEASMRHGRPLPLPLIVPLLGLGGALAAGTVIVLLALG